MVKKVELLAPAGNMDCFYAAINAGADAVYLGGNKYGARAYADNFSEEELISAIHYAHLFEKKVYLTVNTLLKEEELSGFDLFFKPLYEAGVDGVIIQDLGLAKHIARVFPDVERHASTQMTLTAKYGARFLKEQGFTRIVPARELSLRELLAIKNHTDIELECFIHGAMCYSYSGQCLFSSMLGERSGNRGRCAGPCRLPYDTYRNEKKYNKDKQYPISLKDMCMIKRLPELIDAGIDSFKIEGRMKSREYVAGVVSIYRKYIDQIFDGSFVRVDEEDLDHLSKLYIRTEISDGYYFRHNGREMVSISSPGYAGNDEQYVKELAARYCTSIQKLPINMKYECKSNMPSTLSISCGEKTVLVTGSVPEPAMNNPIDQDAIKKQLSKMGNTIFEINHLSILLEDKLFVRVKELNDLRRRAVEELYSQLVISYTRQWLPIAQNSTDFESDESSIIKKYRNNNILSAWISDINQWQGIVKVLDKIDQMILSYDLFQANAVCFKDYSDRIIIALPPVLRNVNDSTIRDLKRSLSEYSIFGILARNMDELSICIELKKEISDLYIIADTSLYAWNTQSFSFLAQYVDEIYAPSELTGKEWEGLQRKLNQSFSYEVYGRCAMMVSAGCIKKTYGCCESKHEMPPATDLYLRDRLGMQFPVLSDCKHCYNIIYNSVVTSLHGQLDHLMKLNPSHLRLHFTTESGYDIANLVNYYDDLLHGVNNPYKIKEFTTGHYKRKAL